jgi:hypothetical protein
MGVLTTVMSDSGVPRSESVRGVSEYMLRSDGSFENHRSGAAGPVSQALIGF